MGYVIKIKPYDGVGAIQYLSVGGYGSLPYAIMFRTETEAEEYKAEHCEDELGNFRERISVSESSCVTCYDFVDGKVVRNEAF